jgi:hypothetical protein
MGEVYKSFFVGFLEGTWQISICFRSQISVEWTRAWASKADHPDDALTANTGGLF